MDFIITITTTTTIIIVITIITVIKALDILHLIRLGRTEFSSKHTQIYKVTSTHILKDFFFKFRNYFTWA
jgi:hypothetical protein